VLLFPFLDRNPNCVTVSVCREVSIVAFPQPLVGFFHFCRTDVPFAEGLEIWILKSGPVIFVLGLGQHANY
jgi:hypothetical protein